MGCRGDLEGRKVVEQAVVSNEEFSATAKMLRGCILGSETLEFLGWSCNCGRTFGNPGNSGCVVTLLAGGGNGPERLRSLPRSSVD